ncbi:translation initiation factor 2 gamma subunit (eIF-2gamma) [Thalassobacillus devorans]|uniref:hypothetical protein n=1 Tax=Thalassobacillus devorans TaxID=279813 RepID=UPI0007845B6D|nr:hypothetical protein [Thalassobacillus devorans]NIK28858.1 translation initiation factor 2 gamma subunit (eIF-2gamma) [Thalassobacillus devorans]
MEEKLSNCRRCGRIFVQNMHPLCQQCLQEEESEYRKIYDFIRKRKSREASVAEVMAETSVAHDSIMKFVKEERLRTRVSDRHKSQTWDSCKREKSSI